MYKPGQLVLYGSTGVCRIIEVKSIDFEKGQRLCYILQPPLYQSCVISTPVDNRKVFMRAILTQEEAEALIAEIPSIRVEIYHSRVLQQLTEHYTACLKSHDCRKLLEMTMSLYAKKKALEAQKRKLGSVDEFFLKRSEELLFGELAAALTIPVDSVPSYIAERVGSLSDEL